MDSSEDMNSRYPEASPVLEDPFTETAGYMIVECSSGSIECATSSESELSASVR